MNPRHAYSVLLVALVGTVAATACGGGGGQLAQGDDSVTSTSAAAGPAKRAEAVAPVPASSLRTPTSVKAVARELTAAESGLRADGRTAESTRSFGRRQERAYRALAAHPEWVSAVVAAVPADLQVAVKANADAGAALASLTPSDADAPTGLPAWEILTPEPPATLRSYYDEAAQATGIPWQYLAAIHLVETRVGRIHGLSSAGAQGPMQFIPETWASYGEGDINSNHDAIQAAGRYLAARGGPTNIDRALFSYNNDDRYVAAVKAYASVLLADPKAFDGYYQWQVFYATRDGSFLLPEGFRGA
ncbi:MAG: lytic transglycosylase domain-containing protein [Acidimicrobiia bacterium]|nr:lytic transglycosylase domain-containing protein [Acidimicrobiia bacterium]